MVRYWEDLTKLVDAVLSGPGRRCPEFSWKWLVATDIKHHYFSLVNQFFRLCGRFFSSVFAL